ncbi:hypothetical protein L0F51_00015 [Afifella sp. H1R]|uniref:hypothetical protein n=1 Tax=Afifella sp. H1R TaxID=2908841 RepID=UPI001F2A5E93|nr:hypothetical protein [Afifella sp. H1R]MCF1502150.1 hypothetical protein [Afifella sp. H1R]
MNTEERIPLPAITERQRKLTRARALAASLVLRHGEELLPIFDRLDRECAALEKREDALDRVRAIAATRAQAAAG